MDKIKEIAKELGITLVDSETDDRYIEEWGRENMINSSYIIGSTEIILGLYKDKQKKIISFFHEVGHTLTDHKELGERYGWDCFMCEIEASYRGIKFAESKGFTFNKKTKQWLYRQAISYVDYK